MIRAVVVGIGGRMGWEVARQISFTNDITLMGGVEHPLHPLCNTVLDEKLVGKPGVRVSDDPLDFAGSVDVLIDFSAPPATIKALKAACQMGVAFVSGTTNLTQEQHQELRRRGEDIPVLWSANMSIGVNLMYKLVEYCRKQLPDSFDVGILDIHHKAKKDAPSGTAKALASFGVCDSGNVLSFRLGSVIGDHTVYFCGNHERLELTHRSQSRAAFAEGVIHAVRFLTGRNKGFYSMLDVFEGFESSE